MPHPMLKAASARPSPARPGPDGGYAAQVSWAIALTAAARRRELALCLLISSNALATSQLGALN